MLGYVLSRLSYVLTMLVAVYWNLYMFNDPFNFGLPSTLDSRIVASDTCEKFNVNNALNNVFYFLLWWLSHSIPARTKVKKALGILNTHLERPLYAICAPIFWFVTLYTWKPISNCNKFDVVEVYHNNTLLVVFNFSLFLFWFLYLVGTMHAIPDHIFGINRKLHKPGEVPVLIDWFPYNLVRHPAAASFLWMYWLFPSYNVNHIFLAVQWSIFIIVGTLVFEEGGLKSSDEFGSRYLKYSQDINAFIPSLFSIKRVLGLEKPKTY